MTAAVLARGTHTDWERPPTSRRWVSLAVTPEVHLFLSLRLSSYWDITVHLLPSAVLGVWFPAHRAGYMDEAGNMLRSC